MQIKIGFVRTDKRHCTKRWR